MSLADAILVSLVDCGKSGYDLAKQFDGSVGFFWKATHQQIYRELTKLEDQGWIVAQAIAQEGRPDKRNYSLTDEGQTHLKDWIAQSCDPPSSKEELLVKIYAGFLVPSPILVSEIERHRQLHAEKLAIYQDIEKKMVPHLANDRNLKFVYLTLRRGLRFESDWIEWCDEAIAMLR
jgi:DNA-binding PadR family transcriptional regulator